MARSSSRCATTGTCASSSTRCSSSSSTKCRWCAATSSISSTRCCVSSVARCENPSVASRWYSSATCSSWSLSSTATSWRFYTASIPTPSFSRPGCSGRCPCSALSSARSTASATRLSSQCSTASVPTPSRPPTCSCSTSARLPYRRKTASASHWPQGATRWTLSTTST